MHDVIDTIRNGEVRCILLDDLLSILRSSMRSRSFSCVCSSSTLKALKTKRKQEKMDVSLISGVNLVLNLGVVDPGEKNSYLTRRISE